MDMSKTTMESEMGASVTPGTLTRAQQERKLLILRTVRKIKIVLLLMFLVYLNKLAFSAYTKFNAVYESEAHPTVDEYGNIDVTKLPPSISELVGYTAHTLPEAAQTLVSDPATKIQIVEKLRAMASHKRDGNAILVGMGQLFGTIFYLMAMAMWYDGQYNAELDLKAQWGRRYD